MKSETYPLVVPPDLLKEVRKVAKRTGLSMADAMRQSMKLGLPKLREQLSPGAGRVTNVEPLPDAVLKRAYSRPERDETGIDRWAKAQATGGRD